MSTESESLIIMDKICLDLTRAREQYAETKQLETNEEYGELVKINCTLPDGSSKEIQIRSGYQVVYVKALLSEEFGLVMRNISLWLNDKMMLDPMSLADYKEIQPGQTTQITVKVAK
eukprot:TRINITY_DN3551_c0_g2_i3.p5 TRINITY_DN3551_c0_g2~~TRINITY_DN3551_c0_g2_i3.p5  ORF type:complete len:117 (+),score=9.39 TRINITY_DN3551_c0_g2_i3:140-490(+)